VFYVGIHWVLIAFCLGWMWGVEAVKWRLRKRLDAATER